jgi:hypothetical protein
MTDVYKHLNHYDIPKRVRNRIIANVEHVMDMLPHDKDNDEEALEDLIEIAYDSYHIGWQAGFIDDTQKPNTNEDKSIMEMASDLADRRSSDSILQFADTSDDDHLFNPGGTE